MTPQLANGYAAALQVGGFTLALLFDFSATPEFGAQWQDLILPRLQQYATHPAATMYNGAALVSTFIGGSACRRSSELTDQRSTGRPSAPPCPTCRS